MEKIRTATNKLDNVNLEISVLKSAVYVLWDSLANGEFQSIDVYAEVVFDLNRKLEAITVSSMEIMQLLNEGIREVSA